MHIGLNAPKNWLKMLPDPSNFQKFSGEQPPALSINILDVLIVLCTIYFQTQATKLCAQWARQMAIAALTIPRGEQTSSGTVWDHRLPY